MAAPVEAFNGQILKFMGDGLLATFDVTGRDDSAVCADALAAAAELQAAFPAFNAEREVDGKPVMDFGLALHLGEVFYGNIGASERLDFTVIGAGGQRSQPDTISVPPPRPQRLDFQRVSGGCRYGVRAAVSRPSRAARRARGTGAVRAREFGCVLTHAPVARLRPCWIAVFPVNVFTVKIAYTPSKAGHLLPFVPAETKC